MNKLVKLLVIISLGLFAGCHASSDNFARNDASMIHRIGIPSTRQMEVTPFTAIETSGLFDLQINTDQPEHQIQMAGDQALLEKITVKVANNTLYLGMKSAYTYQDTGPIQVTVNMNSLRLLHYTGTGKVTSPNLHSDALTIYANGSGQIDLIRYLTLTQPLCG